MDSLKHLLVWVCVCTRAHEHYTAHVEERGQPEGIRLLPPTCGFQGIKLRLSCSVARAIMPILTNRLLLCFHFDSYGLQSFMSDLILWLVQPHYPCQWASIISFQVQWFHIRARSCERSCVRLSCLHQVTPSAVPPHRSAVWHFHTMSCPTLCCLSKPPLATSFSILVMRTGELPSRTSSLCKHY